MYGEHIEEIFKLFKENNPRVKPKAEDIAEDVIEILYSQDEIDDAKADDLAFKAELIEQVKYTCALS